MSAADRMDPAMKRRVEQEIRATREALTAEEQFLKTQPISTHRAQEFRRLLFYREVFADAERRLGVST